MVDIALERSATPESNPHLGDHIEAVRFFTTPRFKQLLPQAKDGHHKVGMPREPGMEAKEGRGLGEIQLSSAVLVIAAEANATPTNDVRLKVAPLPVSRRSANGGRVSSPETMVQPDGHARSTRHSGRPSAWWWRPRVRAGGFRSMQIAPGSDMAWSSASMLLVALCRHGRVCSSILAFTDEGSMWTFHGSLNRLPSLEGMNGRVSLEEV